MKVLRWLGFILILIGLTIPFNYSNKIKEEYLEERVAIEEKLANEEEYFALLEIPDINLKKELLAINDINNNVDKNLLVLKESIFPGDASSNVIIAGHSGNGKNAYFKDLYKVNMGAKIKLYYDNYIYTYEISDIELQDKTGTLYLNNNYQNMITLITCTKNDKYHQTIYYAKLKNQEKIVKN